MGNTSSDDFGNDSSGEDQSLMDKDECDSDNKDIISLKANSDSDMEDDMVNFYDIKEKVHT